MVDNNRFSDAELIEVKVPLHVPYITSCSGYERIDGAIQINGIYYNYVKRKVSNDTLYLQCLPNTAKTKLYQARNVYCQQASDMNGEKNNNAATKKCHLNYEYNQPVAQSDIEVIVLTTTRESGGLRSGLMSPFIDDPYHPPQG